MNRDNSTLTTPLSIPLVGFVSLLGMLWLVTSALTTAREQELPAGSGPLGKGNSDGTGVLKRNAAMNVTVANTLLENGKAKDALSLYKESIQDFQRQSTDAAIFAEKVAAERDWSVSELIQGEFDSDRRKQIIQELLGRGQIWLNDGDYDRAVEAFEKVFILDPVNAKASKGIDRARKELIHARKVEQKEELEEYGSENHDLIDKEFNRALAYIKKGELERAKIHLEQVMLIDPEHREARKLLRQIQEN